jgi:hypothetical protein
MLPPRSGARNQELRGMRSPKGSSARTSSLQSTPRSPLSEIYKNSEKQIYKDTDLESIILNLHSKIKSIEKKYIGKIFKFL